MTGRGRGMTGRGMTGRNDWERNGRLSVFFCSAAHRRRTKVRRLTRRAGGPRYLPPSASPSPSGEPPPQTRRQLTFSTAFALYRVRRGRRPSGLQARALEARSLVLASLPLKRHTERLPRRRTAAATSRTTLYSKPKPLFTTTTQQQQRRAEQRREKRQQSEREREWT